MRYYIIKEKSTNNICGIIDRTRYNGVMGSRIDRYDFELMIAKFNETSLEHEIIAVHVFGIEESMIDFLLDGRDEEVRKIAGKINKTVNHEDDYVVELMN